MLFFARLFFLLIFLFANTNGTTETAKAQSTPPAKKKLKILVYSVVPAHSHMQFMGAIADSLAEAGHEVHFIKTISDDLQWVTKVESNETKLSTKVYRVVLKSRGAPVVTSDVLYPFSGDNAWPMLNAWDNRFVRIFDLWPYFFKEIAFRRELLDELAKERYDVAIYELFDLCGAAIFERIGVRTKLATLTMPMQQISAAHFGIPTFASFVPNWAHPPLNAPTMDFWERLINFLNTFYDWYKLNDRVTDLQSPLVREAFGADFPPLKQLAKNISLFFLNSNKFLEFARPISNKIVYIGGITDEWKKTTELDEKFRSILDNSRSGTVLFSFGTVANTRTLGKSLRRTLLNTFSQFSDYEFIWKLDGESAANESELIKATPNVHTFEWVPQNAIFKCAIVLFHFYKILPDFEGHPKLCAFVTHCGQNSLAEAAKFGVPIVAIPLFADQLYNAVLAKHRGMAVHVDIRQLIADKTGKVLRTALSRVLHDASFRANAKLIRKKIALSPFSAKEQLVRWVEFAAEFPHLNELNMPTDADLGWITYYSIDVILFTIVAAFLAILALFSMLRMAFLRTLAMPTNPWNKMQKRKERTKSE
ncbi:hypothetical protein niasHT_029758 [Heterodera trifolii]|uniref:glucuronosyltransferase n=1 Tax=Heterodera trifolii TaxID=157864 RepID=A0ABD2KQT7_9BILA